MKKARYLFEAGILYVLYFIFSLASPVAASNMGGWVGLTLGPRLGISKRARRHLETYMPHLSTEEREKTVIEMWDNIGRVFAEYPHLEAIARDRITVDHVEIIEQAIADKKGGILIAAHLGNWETNGAALLMQQNEVLNLTYRALNNPYADALLSKARTMNGRLRAYPKARSSGKDIMKALMNKELVGILIDQKYNEGVAVPFFGVPAMTNPVFVSLCQKYKCPLIPVQNIRTGPAQFKIVVHEPIQLFDETGTPLPIETVIQSAHTLLEQWIRDYPGQWLWLHKRWKSGKLTSN